MGRTRDLSFVLWTALAGPALAACGNDGTNHLADAPPGDSHLPIDTSPHFIVDVTTLPLVAACGDAAPPTADVTVTSGGGHALVISAASADNGFSVTTPVPLTIAPSQMATISVRPPAAVVGTDLGGSTVTGTLTLTTNDPGSPTVTIALVSTIHGANISVVDASGSAVTHFSFSSAGGECPAPQAVFIKNSGDVTVQVGTSAGSHFAFAGFASGDVSGGALLQQTVRPLEQGFCADTQEINYQVTGAVCSDASGLTLTATYNMNGASSCFCS